MALGVSTDAASDLAEAHRLLGKDDIASAWTHLQKVLTFPGAVTTSSPCFRETLQLLGTLGEVFAGEEFKEKAFEVADGDPTSSSSGEGLYDLGFEMVGVRQYGVASTLLGWSFAAEASEDTLTELIVSLEREGHFDAAMAYLKSNSSSNRAIVQDSFVCIYQMAWIGIQMGDLAPAFAKADWLLEKCKDMGHDRYVSMAKRIAIVTQRAQRIKAVSSLPLDDLRGWHYVLNGGLLLHVSPHRQDVMHGRYARLQDSLGLCLEAAKKIRLVVQQQEIDIPQVFVLPDPKSSLLAQTLAKVLECECTPWVKGCEEPGILAVYDMEQLEEEGLFYTLYERGHPQQFLWAHAVCWTSTEPCVPAADFVTLLHQSHTSPWDVTDDTPAIDFDEADPKLLVKEILGANVDVDRADLKALAALADAVEFGDGAVQKLRGPQWPTSPVTSKRLDNDETHR